MDDTLKILLLWPSNLLAPQWQKKTTTRAILKPSTRGHHFPKETPMSVLCAWLLFGASFFSPPQVSLFTNVVTPKVNRMPAVIPSPPEGCRRCPVWPAESQLRVRRWQTPPCWRGKRVGSWCPDSGKRRPLPRCAWSPRCSGSTPCIAASPVSRPPAGGP